MALTSFSPQSLSSCLPGTQASCVIAYSGGLDSHVLLYALCQLRDQAEFHGSIRAVHVHHGLSDQADDWARHCREVCESLDVPLEVFSVNVEKQGQGLEDAARKARLAVFEQALGTGEYLLTAHHLDDQMETLLFRLMRGTGIRGLAGIRQCRGLGQGKLWRPLLGFNRKALTGFALQQKLTWIDDDSNTDEALDRNFLRHKVMPQLASRWPGYRKNWQRLAQLADESQQLQQELGEQDLVNVRDGLHRLSIEALLQFSPVRQRNILRTWFLSLENSHGIQAPDYYVTLRILDELVPATPDARPLVSWHKGNTWAEVRRFGGRIYLVLADASFESKTRLTWQPDQGLQLPGQLGILTLVPCEENGFAFPQGALEVGFKQEGQKAKPAGRKTRPLKKIFQDYNVPPWLREKIPLVYQDGELMAVADLFVCDQWRCEKSSDGDKKNYTIQWHRADLHCGY